MVICLYIIYRIYKYVCVKKNTIFVTMNFKNININNNNKRTINKYIILKIYLLNYISIPHSLENNKFISAV